MIFLTIVACEIGRNRYFAGTDQRTGSESQLWIMGILSVVSQAAQVYSLYFVWELRDRVISKALFGNSLDFSKR